MKNKGSVFFLRGDDESLLRDAAREVIDTLVGDGDRSLMVEELAGEDYEIASLVDAAQTPPFLTDQRIVVGRDLGRFTSAESVAPLVAYLADPLPSTALVLVWESGRVPKSLADAVKAAGGEQIDASPGTGKAQRTWLSDQVKRSSVKFDARAVEAIATRIGEDVARVAGLLATLEATYGPGAKLGIDEVEPYLGEAGSVARWELTDAIDRGDIPGSLDRLHRLLAAGDLHPLQLMATLHGHVGRMLALDGAAVANEKDAAALLGIKGSPFPAKKALTQARKLGHDRVARAVDLVATADLDLRGASGLPDDVVLEVLVARLASLARR